MKVFPRNLVIFSLLFSSLASFAFDSIAAQSAPLPAELHREDGPLPAPYTDGACEWRLMRTQRASLSWAGLTSLARDLIPSLPFPLTRNSPRHSLFRWYKREGLGLDGKLPAVQNEVQEFKLVAQVKVKSSERVSGHEASTYVERGILVSGEAQDILRLSLAVGKMKQLQVEKLGDHFLTLNTSDGYFIFNSTGYLVKHFMREPFGRYLDPHSNTIVVLGISSTADGEIPRGSLEVGNLDDKNSDGRYQATYKPDGGSLGLGFDKTSIDASEKPFVTMYHRGFFLIAFKNLANQVQILSLDLAEGLLADEQHIQLNEGEQFPVFDQRYTRDRQIGVSITARPPQILGDDVRLNIEARPWFHHTGRLGEKALDVFLGSKPIPFAHPTAVTQSWDTGKLTLVDGGHNSFVYDDSSFLGPEPQPAN